ncbi:restriction endonuclease, SacI family [Aeromonas sp. QDB03]|uniref:restriction endonuclease, SacI family n=1 Tax=Aeromonas sp. QDB03 TaxID=2989839 RepID=UPI0022E6757B|nr:restriction endonuclease, SacI family [Aeromonas sp. QDB03]
MNVNVEECIRNAYESAVKGSFSQSWFNDIERFNALCTQNNQFTHIMFLGVTVLQRVINQNVNLRLIKPTHIPEHMKGEIGYSARTLCHNKMLPIFIRLGIPCPTSGREPLNNQPYFRMNYLGDHTPFSNEEIKNSLMTLVDKIQLLSQKDAFFVLSSFIKSRLNNVKSFTPITYEGAVTLPELMSNLKVFTDSNSEGGKRAQAIVAGIFDYFKGNGTVKTAGINDPSREYPGDIQLFLTEESSFPYVFVEVRDKPVSFEDVIIFIDKSVSNGVQRCAFVAVSDKQTIFDLSLAQECLRRGAFISFFYSYTDLFNELMMSSNASTLVDTNFIMECVNARLDMLGVDTSR